MADLVGAGNGLENVPPALKFVGVLNVRNGGEDQVAADPAQALARVVAQVLNAAGDLELEWAYFHQSCAPFSQKLPSPSLYSDWNLLARPGGKAGH